MDGTTILGLFASILTSISMLPQFIKILKEKKAESVSVVMPILLVIGLASWVWYGFLKKDWIIVGANGFSVILNLLNLIFTIKYKEKNTE